MRPGKQVRRSKEDLLQQFVWVAEHATSPTLRKEYLDKSTELLNEVESKRERRKYAKEREKEYYKSCFKSTF